MPRVAIFVENGEVQSVIADEDVEYVVLDLDRLHDEDLANISRLAKRQLEFQRAERRTEVDTCRKSYQDKAKQQLRLMTD